jgi:hypothetical protein
MSDLCLLAEGGVTNASTAAESPIHKPASNTAARQWCSTSGLRLFLSWLSAITPQPHDDGCLNLPTSHTPTQSVAVAITQLALDQRPYLNAAAYHTLARDSTGVVGFTSRCPQPG